ncbi:MAG: hypothetical protein AB1345_01020 [Chloroflexota bacterium]
MQSNLKIPPSANPTHSWLRKLNVFYAPGQLTPVLKEVANNILQNFKTQGHVIQNLPNENTDIILTSAPFCVPVRWREALLFTARRRFKINHTPTIYTLIHARPAKLQEMLEHFQRALAKTPPNSEDFTFPGLAPTAPRVLIEQGLRGGPILSLERLLQAQSKSINILMLVGDEHPKEMYHFNLVGAYPRSTTEQINAFYDDITLRIVTTESTHEVTAHQVVGEPIPYDQWKRLSTPTAMRNAGQQIGNRQFFTNMIRIVDLVQVPAVGDAIASQYSEGCFATWDPTLGGLIATITGSARPVDKGNITEDDLAVIAGMKPDGSGAQVWRVNGKRNDPPSSEAVEMIDMDSVLPRIRLDTTWEAQSEVPVVRSKLHGHRGVRSYDPRWVEYVPLDAPYYHYPVSCATAAQAVGIKAAFQRAQSLRNPNDPRQVSFTVLPGHGVVITEKWVPGKAPFQVIWEFMDNATLEIDNLIPQGLMEFKEDEKGKRVLAW